jgi:quinol monooxygenase YgiN
MTTACRIVELRQYTLRPGKRDVLIELFDREFIETQEAEGMTVLGQFRDLDDPDRFVWLRGFDDMTSRARALEAFYGGPVWKRNREVANATMIDSDNVLLLRPARAGSGFAIGERAAGEGRGLVAATIYYLEAPAGAELGDFFERAIAPVLTEAGAAIAGWFVTEHSANTFPALPVREGENVLCWFARFPDRAAHERHVASLEGNGTWRGEIARFLGARRKGAPEVRRLAPTPRSRLQG